MTPVNRLLLGAFLCTATLPAQSRVPGAAEQLSTIYPSRSHTFIKSSSDPDDLSSSPSLGNDDGFSGTNGCEAYRELALGQDAAVLASLSGRAGFLGCIFRNYWSGYYGTPVTANELNRAQVLVDGQVFSDQELSTMFRNRTDPLGQVAPFTGPFTGTRAGGHLTHTPIPFLDSVAVRVFENGDDNAGRFHKVAGTLFGPEGGPPIPDLAAWEAIHDRGASSPHPAGGTTTQYNLSIPAGGSQLVAIEGPATILALRCRVSDPAAWDDLWAVFRWDGQTEALVKVPLRMLGGVAKRPFSAPISSLMFENNGQDEFVCYFPMSFAGVAALSFENRGSTSTFGVDVDATVLPGFVPRPRGYFAACWQEGTTVTGQVFQGPKLIGKRGMLRHILLESGMELSARIPNQTTEHLEGDLCIRINGNRGDDHTFAASETSIGKWGWYLRSVDVPFEQDSSFHTGIRIGLNHNGLPGSHRIQGSTFVFDPVHFVDGIDMVLEHGRRNLSNADYGLLTVFYLQDAPARRVVDELDVGDPVAEAAHQASFTEFANYSRTGNFFRDEYFGTPAVTDSVRHIRDYYRFTVQTGEVAPFGYTLGVRLDRQRIVGTSVSQADVFVDGVRAGRLHAWTSNPNFPWKEGGELEVNIPLALTRGKTSFEVELRPVAGTDDLRLARAWVYGYTAQ